MMQSDVRFLHEIFQADHDVFVATSGADALAFCATNLPDLILADVIMPHMDGYDLCRHLKRAERTREVPGIFVTSHSDTPEEELLVIRPAHFAEDGAVLLLTLASGHVAQRLDFFSQAR